MNIKNGLFEEFIVENDNSGFELLLDNFIGNCILLLIGFRYSRETVLNIQKKFKSINMDLLCEIILNEVIM